MSEEKQKLFAALQNLYGASTLAQLTLKEHKLLEEAAKLLNDYLIKADK